MVGISVPRDKNLSNIIIDCDLAMGAFDITLGAAQTVDGKDVSAMIENIHNVKTGTYVGDGAVSKEIATGFTTLKAVYISRLVSGTGEAIFSEATDAGYSRIVDTGVRNASMMAAAFSGGSFFVDDNGANEFPNASGVTYYYLALGE